MPAKRAALLLAALAAAAAGPAAGAEWATDASPGMLEARDP